MMTHVSRIATADRPIAVIASASLAGMNPAGCLRAATA